MPCIARRGAQTPQVLASVLRTAQQRGLDTTAVLVTALRAAADRPRRLPARPLTRTTRVSRPCTDWITVSHRPVLRLHLSHRPAKQRPPNFQLPTSNSLLNICKQAGMGSRRRYDPSFQGLDLPPEGGSHECEKRAYMRTGRFTALFVFAVLTVSIWIVDVNLTGVLAQGAAAAQQPNAAQGTPP